MLGFLVFLFSSVTLIWSHNDGKIILKLHIYLKQLSFVEPLLELLFATRKYLGGGFPAVVMLFSYLVVYHCYKEERYLGNTWNNTLIRLILGFLLFSLPHVVIKWTLNPFADAVMHCWFWLIFLVNPLIYIFYDEGLRVREGMGLLVRDLRSDYGQKQEEKRVSIGSNIWWIDMTRDGDEGDNEV